MTAYWSKWTKEAEVWNRHPWNRKAKELMEQLEEEEMYAYPEGLYVLQLAEWRLANLPEYQPKVRIVLSMPHLPRDTLHSDLYDLIQSLDAQPESEVRDGIYDRDTVGRVGRGETVRRGVSETNIAGGGSSRDTGEPDGTDAVVDTVPRLEATAGIYTPIREQHIEGRPLSHH